MIKEKKKKEKEKINFFNVKFYFKYLKLNKSKDMLFFA